MSVDNKNLSEIDLGNIIKNIVSYKFSVLLITFFITLISLSLYYLQEKEFTIKYEIKPPIIKEKYDNSVAIKKPNFLLYICE